MQTVSDSTKTLLDSYGKVSLHWYIDGAQMDAGVGNCTYSHACGSEEAFTFGNALSASAILTVDGAFSDLKGKAIQVTWDADGTEYPLLTGTVDNSQVAARKTTITACDAMYFGGVRAYSAPEDLLTDCTAAEAITSVAAIMGVTVESDTLDAAAAVTIEGGLSRLSGEESCAAVLGYIAGLMGGNAMMSRAGTLVIRGFPQTGWTTEPYAGGALADNTDFTVTGITLQRDETQSVTNSDGTTGEQINTVEFFAGDGSLALVNLLASQDAAERAWAALKGTTVRPGQYTFPGGLLLEPGDLFTVTSMDGDYPVAAAVIGMTLDGGVRTTVSCGGAAADGGAMGGINQALNALAADIVRIRKLIADNAEINSANIGTLTALQAQIGSDLDQLETEFSVLDGQITARVEAVESDVNGLETSISSLEVTTEGIKTEVSEIKESTDEALSRAETAQDTAEGAKSSVEQLAKSITARVETVETTLNSAVSDVDVEYALGDSATEAPEDGWSTVAPEWVDGKYMWQRTVTTYADGSSEVSDPTNITGATGAAGEDAVLLQILSSNGHMFKNSEVSTTLTVEIITGGVTIDSSSAMLARFGASAKLIWQEKKHGETEYTDLSEDDSRISDNGFIFTLNAEGLEMDTVYKCLLDY